MGHSMDVSSIVPGMWPSPNNPSLLDTWWLFSLTLSFLPQPQIVLFPIVLRAIPGIPWSL